MQIYISYLPQDTHHLARRLYERLSQVFGRDAVVIDISNVSDAGKITDVLLHVMEETDVALVLIGQNWMTAADDQGNPLVFDVYNHVNSEVETALRTRNCTVIPVLINGTSMPREDKLPYEVRDLAEQTVAKIRRGSEDNDINKLIATISAGRSNPVQRLFKKFTAPREAASASRILPRPLQLVSIDAGRSSVIFQYDAEFKTVELGPYSISKYPLLTSQYRAFLNAKDGYANQRWWYFSDFAFHWRRRHAEPSFDEHNNQPEPYHSYYESTGSFPVVVAWYDAVAFTRWLSARTGRFYTLPSAPEWIRAAGGNFTIPDGSDKNYRTGVAISANGGSPMGVMGMIDTRDHGGQEMLTEWTLTAASSHTQDIHVNDERSVSEGEFPQMKTDRADDARHPFHVVLLRKNTDNGRDLRLERGSSPIMSSSGLPAVLSPEANQRAEQFIQDLMDSGQVQRLPEDEKKHVSKSLPPQQRELTPEEKERARRLKEIMDEVERRERNNK